jgi:CHRD domain
MKFKGVKWTMVVGVMCLTTQAMSQSKSPVLDPSRGSEIGARYESWLSPHQEGGEESQTPAVVPKIFRSTTPSVNRDQRPSRGHGMVRFSKDLSRAYVDVRIEGVDPKTITMFHIHCGKPGQLGPILIDFGLKNDLKVAFEKNTFTAEIRNDDLVAVTQHSHGVIGFATAGCPIILANPADRVKTVAGMAAIAREGDLYFNLHTSGQTYFGDIRGQLERVQD